MIFRKKTLQTLIQDEMMKALVQHETRVLDRRETRVRESARTLTGSEEANALAAQLETERAKNVALVDEKDELIRQVKGLQQVMLATNQETLRLALVDATRSVAQEFRAQIREARDGQ